MNNASQILCREMSYLLQSWHHPSSILLKYVLEHVVKTYAAGESWSRSQVVWKCSIIKSPNNRATVITYYHLRSLHEVHEETHYSLVTSVHLRVSTRVLDG